MPDLDAAVDLAVTEAAIAAALLTEFAPDGLDGEIRSRALDAVMPIVAAGKAAERERRAAEPSRDQVRGAVDWALYFYSLPGPARAGEDDQTDALYRVLGDGLAERLIDCVQRARAADLSDHAPNPEV